MPTKIRLQRQGTKGRPFYHIVVADGRAPRDGRFIEKIGTYNPLTKPAEIDLNFDKAVDWMQKGAQPTDTARAILSYKGVLYKNHLLNGVKKNALTLEDVEVRVAAWLAEKQSKIVQGIKDMELEVKTVAGKKLAAERAINEKRANAIADKRSTLAAEAARASSTAEEVAETVAPTEVAEQTIPEETATQPDVKDTTEPAELAEVTEAEETAELPETEDTTGPVEPTEPAELTESTEAEETAEPSDLAELAEPEEPAEPTEPEEPTELT